MPALNKAEYEELCRANCPYCRAGNEVKFRKDTSEFIHDHVGKGTWSHTLCLSNGLRNEMMKQFDNG